MSELGVCKYCGAASMVDGAQGGEQEERDSLATINCRCPDAREAAERKLRIERAIVAVDNLFGLNAYSAGFDPLPDNGVLEFLKAVILLIANGQIRRIAVQIDGETKAILSLGTMGKINIERSDVNKRKVEG